MDISGWTHRGYTRQDETYGELTLYSCQWHDTFSPPEGNKAYAWFDQEGKRRSQYTTLPGRYQVKIGDQAGKSLW